jgi:hypothetical protein
MNTLFPSRFPTFPSSADDAAQHRNVQRSTAYIDEVTMNEIKLQDETEWVTVAQLAAHTGVPASFFYERSRHDAIPGQVRVGRYVRIHLPEFLAAMRDGQVR